MIEIILLLCFMLAFLVTFFTTPSTIWKGKQMGLMEKDVHKLGKVLVPGFGGIPIFFGLVAGVFLFIGINTLGYSQSMNSPVLFASIICVSLIFVIGIIDDLFQIRWRTKVFLPLVASIPLIAIEAGHTIMYLPFIGNVDFGLVHLFIFIPIGITGAANAVNMIAGYNGVETGMGAIMCGTLLLIAWDTGQIIPIILLVCMLGALLAFYYFNAYPSKIFMGDSGTFQIGALIATVCIIGNMESYGAIMFSVYFINAGIFFYSYLRFGRGEKFAKVDREEKLIVKRVDTLYYFFIWLMKPTEKQMVYLLLVAQACASAAALLYHFGQFGP